MDSFSELCGPFALNVVASFSGGLAVGAIVAGHPGSAAATTAIFLFLTLPKITARWR